MKQMPAFSASVFAVVVFASLLRSGVDYRHGRAVQAALLSVRRHQNRPQRHGTFAPSKTQSRSLQAMRKFHHSQESAPGPRDSRRPGCPGLRLDPRTVFPALICARAFANRYVTRSASGGTRLHTLEQFIYAVIAEFCAKPFSTKNGGLPTMNSASGHSGSMGLPLAS